jgi:hypothetical protein
MIDLLINFIVDSLHNVYIGQNNKLFAIYI